MLKSNTATHSSSISRQLYLIGCLVLLLSLFPPVTALAGPPDPGYEGPEKCAECHSVETEAWQNSSHAKAMTPIDQANDMSCDEEGEDCRNCLSCHTTDFDPVKGTFAFGGVTCEACHGPYVEDHPKDGTMQLDVDSSVCHDCHVDTHEQWKESSHGQVGVQCIGCHLSHSQDFRLTDETLCGACHRDRLEDFAHTAHSTEDVTCTDCHMSSGLTQPGYDSLAMTSTEYTAGRNLAPSHRFAAVPESCVGCHKQTIHEESLHTAVSQVENVQLLAMADYASELDAELKAVKQANKSLQTAVFVTLGLGLGIGAWVGIFFMLIIGYIIQGRARK